jgi:hypothetical protein
MNKYAAISRSHLMRALHQIDCELEHTKSGGKRHSELIRERSELQSALQERNAELLNRWEKGVLYGHYTPSELARFEQLDQYEHEITSRNRGSAVGVPGVRHVAKRARILRTVGKKKHGTRNKAKTPTRHAAVRHGRSSRGYSTR